MTENHYYLRAEVLSAMRKITRPLSACILMRSHIINANAQDLEPLERLKEALEPYINNVSSVETLEELRAKLDAYINELEIKYKIGQGVFEGLGGLFYELPLINDFEWSELFPELT